MARYFLDSSALVKRYHVEAGTADVEALIASSDNRFFISRLALVEVQSSLARLVRAGVLTELGFRASVTLLEEDIATGLLTVAAVSSRRLEGAPPYWERTASHITFDRLMLFISRPLKPYTGGVGS